jgi:thiol-disulfide isomerase/thioredoxin
MEKPLKIFNRDPFIGMGAGILVTLFVLLLFVSYYMFSWWSLKRNILSGKTSVPGKTLESKLEAPSFPSTSLADYDWTVQSLDGQEFKMSETKGKVVFLNFWATWCAPCVAEMPSIQRLHEKLKDDGIAFVCISNEEASKISQFVRERKVTFPIYTMRGAPPAIYKARGIPATFILSPDGKIAFRHIGSAKWDDEKSIDFIKGLIK